MFSICWYPALYWLPARLLFLCFLISVIIAIFLKRRSAITITPPVAAPASVITFYIFLYPRQFGLAPLIPSPAALKRPRPLPASYNYYLKRLIIGFKIKFKRNVIAYSRPARYQRYIYYIKNRYKCFSVSFFITS